MQIKSILLYRTTGEIRTLDFKLGEVNIITGASRTGKSAVIDILDYCLGRSTFNIFEGVNRDVVSWYGVLFQLHDRQVLIVKPAPKGLAQSQSQAYWEEGTDIILPPLASISLNTTDDSIKQNLSRLLGISANQTIVNEGRTTDPFQATIDHAKFYLFQDQGLVANKKLLFWRQSEPYIPQHIKDTIPYFLGAVQEDRLKLVEQLRDNRRKLRGLNQEVSVAKHAADRQFEGARNLIIEAKAIGLLETQDVPNEQLFEVLNNIASWNPQRDVNIVSNSFIAEREQIRNLRIELRAKHQEIQEAESYLIQADGFANEANEQVARLKAAQVFTTSVVDHESCPLCNNRLETPTPTVENLLMSLDRLRAGVNSVQRERPRIEEYVSKLRDEYETIRQTIRTVEKRLNLLIEQQESELKLRDINLQAARVAGRISLYLENFKIADNTSSIPSQLSNLESFIRDLEEQLDIEQVEEALASILNVIGAQMTLRAKALMLEHANNSHYRLDVKKLSVVADSPERPVVMERMGSAENYLGCHVIALLSLHEYFIRKKRPVPNFLILDQPSQVYFPTKDAYLALDGKSQKLEEIGGDVLAVQRLFDLLFSITKELYPNFQIIIMEHANLDDARFQDALVEEPWTGGKALIPNNWLND